MDSIGGRYEVTTASSSYLIDLDRQVIRRLPRTGSPEGSLLRRDDELITLLEVIECSVGRRMILLLDLHVFGVPFTARFATQVLSIDPVASPGVEAAQ
ncbi:hypothetical protein [Terrimesophilobacter mesophilus]|jgi:hypothetical protein|nr:hypothetical protein [Terrimesophilobacter mesophilus]